MLPPFYTSSNIFYFSCSLQFLAFDTEASHDMLKVWDGPAENEMSLSELSGSLLPEGIHSTLNTVTVQFETDFYISKSGFAIEFSSKRTTQQIKLAESRNSCAWSSRTPPTLANLFDLRGKNKWRLVEVSESFRPSSREAIVIATFCGPSQQPQLFFCKV